MSSVVIRPRFQTTIPLSSQEVLSRIASALSQDATICGRISDHHVVLGIPEAQQHFWSPQLSLDCEALQSDETLVRGLFGPRPSVWLLFVFFYALLGFLSVIVAIIGFSQLNLGLSGGILWILPVLLGVIGLMFLSARAGQNLGREEMNTLYRFFQEAVTVAPVESVS